MDAIFSSYAWSQLILLPLVVYYLKIDILKVSWTHLRKIRISLTLSVLILPLLLWGVSLTPSLHVDTARTGADSRRAMIMHPEPRPPITSGDESRSDAPFYRLNSAGTKFPQRLTSIAKSVGYADVLIDALSDFAKVFSGIGLFLFLIRTLLDAIELRRLIRTSEKYELTSRDVLYTSDAIQAPFSLWLGKGMIFLPKKIPIKVSNAILKHECCHTRSRHTLWALPDLLHGYLFWYNPLSILLKRRNRLIMELECDGKVIEQMDRVAYAQRLFDYAYESSSARSALMGIQGFGGISLFKRRMEYLLCGPTRKIGLSRWIGFLSIQTVLILSLVIVGCSNSDREAVVAQKISQKYGALTAVHGESRLPEMPPILINAFLLREDKNFYNHGGTDTSALFRAAFNTLTGKGLQGGSTITQQLAKLLLLEDKMRTLRRKIKQLTAAHTIENIFSKDEILEMYLNSLYFEAGVYGVQSAAHHFFGHSVQTLTPAESAALAVIVSSPQENNFRKNPKKAQRLQRLLLKRLVENGHLSEADAGQSFESFWQSV